MLDKSIEYINKVKKVFEKDHQFYSTDQSRIALLRICQVDPDVFIMGTNLGDTNSLKFMKQIIKISPSSVIIVVEKDYSPKRGKIYKKEGAYEYLRKSDNLEILIETINEVFKNMVPHKPSEKELF